jgi:putative transposase
MPDSYVATHIHFVFSTKHRARVLTAAIRERLWQYIGGIAREHRMTPISVGGYEDHCHALVGLPSSMPVAKAAQLLKGGSSHWLSATFPEFKDFEWQKGYGAFSISISHIGPTVRYIQNQEQHHMTQSFDDEFAGILRKHRI